MKASKNKLPYIGGYILLFIICFASLGSVDANKRDTAIVSFLGGLFVGVIVVSSLEDKGKE